MQTKAIESVKAVLTNLTTKKTSEISALTQTPSFANLTSGRYKIEIVKNGYQRRIKEVELNCKTVDKILMVSKTLYLQKGDVKKITEFNPNVYGVLNHKGQYTAKPSDEAGIGDKALRFAKPKYPAAAHAARASGAVQVQVTIDEDGEIAAANAISGHPLLRQAAEAASKETRFAPTLLSGKPVKITGIIVYNFIP
jgi:TonB family protein